jgi:hypothetical protein
MRVGQTVRRQKLFQYANTTRSRQTIDSPAASVGSIQLPRRRSASQYDVIARAEPITGFNRDATASTLALFMSRVAAHHEHHATAANDFAVLTNALDAGADFHGGTLARKLLLVQSA